MRVEKLGLCPPSEFTSLLAMSYAEFRHACAYRELYSMIKQCKNDSSYFVDSQRGCKSLLCPTLESLVLYFPSSEDSDDEEAEEEMHVDESKENEDDEVAHALAAADALGKATQVASVGADDIADGLKELDMDNYDDEEDGIELFGSGLKDLYYASNDLDPYLKDKDNDSEEDDDMIIRPDDSVIVCASNEDDVSQLEANPSDGEINMYVQRAIIIPAFPLCTAWLDCPIKGGERGNFIAVSSMEPAIEIWDIDIIDEVHPSVILGGIDDIKKKGKKKIDELTLPVAEDITEAKMKSKSRSSTKLRSGCVGIEKASAIQLAEINGADSLEKDVEQGKHDLVKTEKVFVVPAEGNEYDSLERNLDQGLTTSNVEVELAESQSFIADNALESMIDNPEIIVKEISAVEEAQPLEMMESPIRHDEDNVGAYQILGISSLVLSLLAGTVLYVKRRSDKTLHPVAVSRARRPSEMSIFQISLSDSKKYPKSEDYVTGASCLSEMSIFQISLSHRKKYPKLEDDEAQSIEKKPRKSNKRESLVASEFSICSPSYRSFTTYERIPAKHASGEEEVITHVRRSSKIRSHVYLSMKILKSRHCCIDS
ncbi:hypothetical protein CQW23_29858 [Capsicum baccatum]|uniref:Uncharacterized protein n=1 Tax=Capsicum baccatum TaxID=33114 RepID=A0A2G2VC46_CAPBA|nr:hypothetical protein CQW23_29858 [Capsicum baccatum]